MHTTPSGQASGATVRDIYLRTLDDESVQAIRSAWLEHKELSFPEQDLSDDHLEAFTLRFGPEFGVAGGGPRHDSVTDRPSASTIDLDLLARNRLTLIGVTFRTRTPEEALECSRRFAADLLPAFDTGESRPVLDRTFPFEHLPAARDYMGSATHFGKIVLVP